MDTKGTPSQMKRWHQELGGPEALTELEFKKMRSVLKLEGITVSPLAEKRRGVVGPCMWPSGCAMEEIRGLHKAQSPRPVLASVQWGNGPRTEFTPLCSRVGAPI